MTAVSTQVTPTPPAEVGEMTSPGGVLDLLRLAVERGLPVEALERLQALHERVSDRAAAMEFAAAMASFQASCPPIAKRSLAKITTRGGGSYTYRYAELDEIARTVNPILRDLGLSYTWDSEGDGKTLAVTCTLRHVNGHAVTARFALPTDNASAMSDQQKQAAALTYARRQSLIQVLGLTTTDPDTDAADPSPITDDQRHDLEILIQDTGAHLERVCRKFGVASLAELPARRYDEVVNALRAFAREKARRGQAAGGGS